jgi:hypothetical protein
MMTAEEEFFNDLGDPTTALKHIAQGSDQWDQIRVGRFTSSEIHRLMGTAYREMTPEELKARPKSGKGSAVKRIEVYGELSDKAETYIKEKVAETITGIKKETSYAYPLVYGKEMEPNAVEYFQRKTGLECEEIGFIAFGDHAGGSPDRKTPDGILEVKCPYSIEMQIDYLMLTDQWDLKRMKPEYFWQCQSNLLFTNAEVCHFITYDPRYPETHRMTHIQVKPDEDAFNAIVKKLEAAVKRKLETLRQIKFNP